MHRRIEALKEDHGRLRSLLDQCESAALADQPLLLRQLRDALRPHVESKQALYAEALPWVQGAGNPTELSLLGIFRTNLGVVTGAVLSFLDSPDPRPDRQKERLRTVVGALRSLLETEEKVVFPLCMRHSGATGAVPRQQARARFEEGR